LRLQQPVPWLVGDAGNGLFPSLPDFLEDLRPSGFVGRRIGRRLSDEWGIPSDPRHWNDDNLGRFLLRRGDDLPGELVVGDAPIRCAFGSPPAEPLETTGRG
jgi:hypothetical protein